MTYPTPILHLFSTCRYKFYFLKELSFSVVPQVLLYGKIVISEKGQFPHFQKWKEIYFCEKINFGISFIIPELNVGNYIKKNSFIFQTMEGHTKVAARP